jgi:hypothetical protein
MSKKKQHPTNYNYLIVNLSSFLKYPQLQSLTFKDNKPLQKQMNKLLYNSYAVSENHPNITMITMIAVQGGAYWRALSGEHELVKPLI